MAINSLSFNLIVQRKNEKKTERDLKMWSLLSYFEILEEQCYIVKSNMFSFYDSNFRLKKKKKTIFIFSCSSYEPMRTPSGKNSNLFVWQTLKHYHWEKSSIELSRSCWRDVLQYRTSFSQVFYWLSSIGGSLFRINCSMNNLRHLIV